MFVIRLKGDVDNPGANKVYGTDIEGTRGWQDKQTIMTGANGTVAGTAGVVPTPAATDNLNFLRGDGTWQSVASGSHNHDITSLSNAGTVVTRNTGTASGNVPILDETGKLNTSVLPAIAITDTFTAESEAEMLALTSAEQGDVAIRLDVNKTYILTTGSPTVLNNWQEILSPIAGGGGVTSVNGKTGAVSLTFTDVNAACTVHPHESTDIMGLGTSATMNTGTSAGTVATGNHNHSSVYAPITHTHNVNDVPLMIGANGTAAGTKGLVPQPISTDNVKFLRGDGTWQNVSGSVASVNGKTGTVVLSNTDVGAAATTHNHSISEVTFNGDLIPDGDGTRSIGSASNKIKDIHLSGGTLYIGDGKISYNSTTSQLEIVSSATGTALNVGETGFASDGTIKLNSLDTLGFIGDKVLGGSLTVVEVV